MKLYELPEYVFDYMMGEVISVFYNRYPNSFAKHIISEDVLSRQITEDKIITKKLIVKKGSTFLKSVPKWVSGQTNVQFMPTLEESIFDRNAGTLITHTRNASWIHTLNMTEKCFYRKIENGRTAVNRTLSVKAYCRFSGIVEQFLMQLFRKSTGKTIQGYHEKLVERFGPRNSHIHQGLLPAGGKTGEMMKTKLAV